MKALISLLLFLPSLAFADVSVPRAKQYAWTVYDTAVLGGASVPGSQNPISLGLALPAGIVITDVWVYINTAFAATGTESLGLACVNSGIANQPDLMAFTSVKNLPANNILLGRMAGGTFVGAGPAISSVPAALNFNQGFGTVPNGCNVSAVIQGLPTYTPYTAGKLTAIIEYFKL